MVQTKQEKRDFVEGLKKELKAAKVVAVANLENLPAKHLNSIRKKIGGKAKIAFGRSKLMLRAMQEARPDLKELEQYMDGNSALMLTDESVFKIAKMLRQSKSSTLAKPGQIAPNDIIVPGGETSLPPGPVLTELKQAGVQAKIQGPKVVITADAVVAKKGQVITAAVAGVLSKLAIQPMEIGMNLKAAFEDGLVFKADVLDLDDKYWLSSLATAHQEAVNLSVDREIFNKYSTELLVQKAARQANAIQKLVEGKAGSQKEEAKPAEAAGEKPSEGAPAA